MKMSQRWQTASADCERGNIALRYKDQGGGEGGREREREGGREREREGGREGERERRQMGEWFWAGLLEVKLFRDDQEKTSLELLSGMSLRKWFRSLHSAVYNPHSLAIRPSV